VKPRWETPKPAGVVGSYGDQAIEWARRERGIIVGPWQARAITAALRYDKDGDLIHRTVLLGTGRQNGKSVIVRVIVGWLLDEGRLLPAFDSWTTILAAAHDAKQARILYKGVYNDLSAIPRLREASGGMRKHQTVRLTEHFGISVGDLTLDTVTGQPGSSRGLSAGLVAWDEVMTQRDWDMWEALSPTQSAQRNPLMILTSTAGLVDSIVLRAFYDRLVGIASGDRKPDRTFYGAWWQSSDPDAGLDWKQIRMANPALGDGRLTRHAIKAEHDILPPDSWRRERLNHFVDLKAAGAFNAGVWAACRTAEPLQGLDGPYVLAVDVQSGWQRATISVAGMRVDGRVGVEVLRDIREDDSPVTAARIIAELEAFPGYVASIVFDSISGIGPELRRRAQETGLPYVELSRGDFVAACMDVTEMIHSGRLAVDDPLLDAQMPMVAKRSVGADGAFCFSRGDSLGPIDAFLSMTFAANGIASFAGFGRVLG
jgi:hypothetical protein